VILLCCVLTGWTDGDFNFNCLKVWCNTALESVACLVLVCVVPYLSSFWSWQVRLTDPSLKASVHWIIRWVMSKLFSKVNFFLFFPVNLSQMFLNRIGGGLSCVDSTSQLSKDNRICLSGIGNMSHQLPTSSTGSRMHGRVTPSAFLVLSLQKIMHKNALRSIF